MAEMIPDRLPARASAGEKRLFAILQQLSDDIIVYYEPVVESRYPDFVIIHPKLGLMIIEVKGWYPRDILAADNNSVLIRDHQVGEARMNHPVKQAREYMLGLMDQSRRSPHLKRLLNEEGEFQGRFVFPFGHFALLSNITRDQLIQHNCGDLNNVFPKNKVLARDEFLEWEEQSPQEVEENIRGFFDPFWPITPLDESAIEAIRAVVHPQIVISSTDQADVPASEPLKVLDTRQEHNARKIGEGHRIIYGVAGSGKTVLLLARIKLVASESPDIKVLLLCYNVALAAYLRSVLKEYPNVLVIHFHKFARQNGASWKRDESNKELGERLLQQLQAGSRHTRAFDFVAVDEMQDFEPAWFLCVLEAMKDPLDGDLLIVGDGSQGLFKRTGISWQSLGIQAKGNRTLYKSLDLDKNYRNTKEIARLAEMFAEDDDKESEDSILSIKVKSENCVRESGVKPLVVKSDTKADELKQAVALAKSMLDGRWAGKEIEPLSPGEIAVVYPRLQRQHKGIFKEFLHNLGEVAPCVWVTDPDHWKKKEMVTDERLKVQTIHSSKGLQYRAIIVVFAGDMPGEFGDIDVEEERRLLYVAMTRAEDYLAITYSDTSEFVSRIIDSGFANLG